MIQTGYNPFEINTDKIKQAQDEANSRIRAHQIERKRRYMNTFNTEDGKWVLDDLVNNFLNLPTIPDGMGIFEMITYAPRAEGRKDVVRLIQTRINPEEE